MKKIQEIIGLPIISISDGIEVGRVKNVITNAAKGAIDYIVVDSGVQILSAKIIPSVNILGIGEYALTIENEEAINDLSKLPPAIDLLQKNIQVTGNKVLTKKGRLIGEVGDIYVDENDNCSIQGLEYIADITHKNIRIIPRASVITFGKNLVVVIEEVENTLLDKLDDIKADNNAQEIEKKNLMSNGRNYNKELPENIVIETDKLIAAEGDSLFKEIDTSYQKQYSEFSMLETTGEDFPLAQNDDSEYDDLYESYNDIYLGNDFKEYTESIILKDGSSDEKLFKVDDEEVVQITQSQNSYTDKASNVPSTQSGTISLFEQRQKQYLNGRKATKTITANSGEVIISEGSIITDEVIDFAKGNGKLIELVMNNKA